MSKETSGQLSDEFKKEIRENGNKKNILGTLTALIAVLLVFGTIGVAGYELIFKPEKIEQKSAEEKIESRPAESINDETPVETPVTAPAPVAEKAPFVEYTVVSGDSYSSIANANGMSSADLMTYNGVTSEDLQIGQVIKIPNK
jgi:LysM repeat protein